MGKAIAGLPEAPALSGSEAHAPPEATGSLEPDRIGVYLARQRRLRGISLEELEALTHIPRRSLERLEGGAFDRDPDGFARGFVRTVAGAIGLDPEETVSRMLGEPVAERTHAGPGLGRLLLGLGAVAALVALLALAPGVLRFGTPTSDETVARMPAPAPVAAPERVRRDAVRALAAEVGALPVRPPPSAAARR